MEGLYIPIKNGNECCFMDASNLSLSQLIELRDELIDCMDSVSVIDGIIKECHLERIGYKEPYYYGARAGKKIRKKEKFEKKRKCRERKDK